MGSIVVCGGGPIGLLAATILARDGHQVTVLETDSEQVPRRLARRGSHDEMSDNSASRTIYSGGSGRSATRSYPA
jgi:2-polyprenyl-6-methoxyphenol hydroxylase-like FAD-dependent oxidoreductase